MNPFTRMLNLLDRIDTTTTKVDQDLAEIDRRLTIIEGRTEQMSADLDAMLSPHRYVA